MKKIFILENDHRDYAICMDCASKTMDIVRQSYLNTVGVYPSDDLTTEEIQNGIGSGYFQVCDVCDKTYRYAFGY
jgi:hypothetical protein